MKSLHSDLMSILFLVVSALVPVVVFGGDPPPIPPQFLPPAVTPTGPIVPFIPPPLVPDPGGPMTLARLERAGLSSPVYYAFRRALTQHPKATTSSTDIAPSYDERITTGRLPIVSLAYVSDTVKATDDTLQDAEPSVVALNKNGSTYTIAAANHYTNISGFITGHINTASTTTMQTGSFTHAQLPIPVDRRGSPQYQDSSDPFLAANVSSGGIAPGRVYCSGVMFTPNPFSNPSAIGLWRSDDGGVTWAAPINVASQGGGGYFDDKPSMAVSYYLGTLGHVYVTWVTRDFNLPGSSSVWVARSTDGGLTFEPAVVISYDDVQGPIVVVDASLGDVYCIWVNERYSDLRMAKSSGTGGALSFGPHEVISGANLLSVYAPNIHGGVRAATLPMARYNWYAGRLGVVWHAGVGGDSSNTDVYYSYKPCSHTCNGFGWEQPILINDVTTNDQFMPALDYFNGDFVIGFYDRRDDTGNLLYRPYFAYIHSDGTPTQPNTMANSLQSNPQFHTSSTGDANFIGDYHELWTWTYPEGTRAIDSWIGILNQTVIGDVYLTRIAVP